MTPGRDGGRDGGRDRCEAVKNGCWLMREIAPMLSRKVGEGSAVGGGV